MNLSNILTMIGGLALFLYGMHILGNALTKVSGSRMESLLAKMTDSPLKGVALGAGITAIIQSSSAATVMVVGCVNSGIMQLGQAVGIIMGANIGTTITSWFLSLSGIKSDNILLTLLKPETFSPLLSMIGVLFLLFSKSERKKEVGGILLGFSILMFGMDTMGNAMEPLKDMPGFTRLFLAFSNPVMGMIAGCVLTALMQSSSASIGILQALCMTGTIPYAAVLPIIMGQNIGTCITALLSSIGTNTHAKRAAFIHLYFNLIGTLLFMGSFYTLHAFIPFRFPAQTATPAGIAAIHSCFNILATIVLLPFSGKLVKLAIISVRERSTSKPLAHSNPLAALSYMDKRFLDNPSLALSQCHKAADAMMALANEAVSGALSLLFDYQTAKEDAVTELRNCVEKYEDAINDYMSQIGRCPLSANDWEELVYLQHCVCDIERIAGYSSNILESVRKMKKKDIHFSKEAKTELCTYCDIILALMKHAMGYLESHSQDDAEEAIQLAHEQDCMEKRMLKSHKRRLKKGKCSVSLGFILADLLSHCRKITEHSLHVTHALPPILPAQKRYPETLR